MRCSGVMKAVVYRSFAGTLHVSEYGSRDGNKTLTGLGFGPMDEREEKWGFQQRMLVVIER